MNYSSVLFLAVFLPLTILIYNLLPQKQRWKVLLIASYIFFWSISGKLLAYILIATLIMHQYGLWFSVLQNKRDEELKEAEKENKKKIKEYYNKRQKGILIFAITVLLGMLVVLKYSAFLATNINSLMKLLKVPINFEIPKFIMPIGISFYTLQAISYIFDVYKGKIEADENLARLALFISFFPQIMEGPIARYSQTAQQLWKCEKVTYESLTFGIQRMTFGLMKKIVIADRLNTFVNNVFDKFSDFDGGIIAIAMILYTVQLYMDFSGTMDIVIGIGEIFKVKLPENFKQPFFSKTISEFWTRWHITLGAWFRDYIFYPVSLTDKCKKITTKARKKLGNYYGALMSSSIALFCVWICNGIWHGSAWNYIFFGLYHFSLILFERMLEPVIQKITAFLHINRKNWFYEKLQILRTTCLVFVGELFFRANGFRMGWQMFKKMIFQFSLNSMKDNTIFYIGLDKYDFGVIGVMVFAIFIVSVLKEKGIKIRKSLASKNIVLRWTVYYTVIFTIIIFGAYGNGYVPVDPMYAEF